MLLSNLKDFKAEVDVLIEKKDLKKDEAIFNVLREYIKANKKHPYLKVMVIAMLGKLKQVKEV